MVCYRKLFVGVIAAAASAFSTTGTIADDWPQWMGPQGDGEWREQGLTERFAKEGPPIRWKTKLGPGYGGPSVVASLIYVMDRVKDERKGTTVENNIRQTGKIAGSERLVCLESKTGSVRWEHVYDCPYSIAYPTGPRCTPTVDGDRVYSLGAMGDLYCLDRHTGDVIWHVSLAKRYQTNPPPWGYASHPLIDGRQLIVPAGGDGSAVVALDKQTGKELWRSATTRDIGYAPLTICRVAGERQLIFWHADGVTSLDPASGKSFWSVNFPEQPSPSVVTIATPRFSNDRLLVSDFYKGSLLLKLSASPPRANEVWRSNRTDPRSRKSINALMTTPIVKDGHIYGIAYDGRGRGVFRCLELESGNVKWTKEDWLAKEPLPFATAFLVHNRDHYYLFADTGELLIVRLSPHCFEELARAQLLEPTSVARGRHVVWSHPAFSNGTMYARNDNEIIAVDLRASKRDDKNIRDKNMKSVGQSFQADSPADRYPTNSPRKTSYLPCRATRG